MMTVHYTGGSVLMASDVAGALIRYARVLAAAQSSDILVVPVIDESGAVSTAEFLIGPASQLLVVPVAGVPERARDQAVIDDIHARARRFGSSIAVSRAGSPDSTPFDHDRS